MRPLERSTTALVSPTTSPLSHSHPQQQEEKLVRNKKDTQTTASHTHTQHNTITYIPNQTEHHYACQCLKKLQSHGGPKTRILNCSLRALVDKYHFTWTAMHFMSASRTRGDALNARRVRFGRNNHIYEQTLTSTPSARVAFVRGGGIRLVT
jgi:hypothetical protein